MFDENLGPHARLLPFYELTQEPDVFAEVAAAAVPGPLGKAKPLIGAYARTYTRLRWNADSDAEAEQAREAIVAAIDKLEAELSRATASSSSARASPSPTSPPPRSSTRWSSRRRARCRPTCRAPRPSSASARASATAAAYKWVEETFRKHRRR